MRVILALAISLALAPLAQSADDGERGRLAVSIIQVNNDAVIVAWTPAPGAVSYEVYRGTSPETATKIAETRTTAILDEAPQVGNIWYIVRSVQLNSDGGSYGGSCVDHHGTTGVSVTTKHCL